MREIQLLLDKVLRGDEKAFQDFCLARTNVSWNYINTLTYFHEKVSKIPEKLDKCYPGMFVELGYFLKGVYPVLKVNQIVISIIDCIKRAAKNNDGAKVALLLLMSERSYNLSITSAARRELIEQVRSVEKKANLSKHQLYLLGYLNYYLDDISLGLYADNHAKAVEYIKKAVALEHAAAAYVLDCMYQQGLAGTEMSEEARNKEMYERNKKVAARGDSLAMMRLGYIYEQGKVRKDLSEETRNKEAFVWYKLAAALGNITAMINLGHMFEKGKIGKDLPEDDRNKVAVEWYKKAAALGNADAMFRLCWMHEACKSYKELLEEEQNKEAYDAYKKAAASGNADAITKLGWMYEVGKVGKDLNEKARLMKAKEYYLQALQSASLHKPEEVKHNFQRVTQKLVYLEQLRTSQVTHISFNQARSPISPTTILQTPKPVLLDKQLLEMRQKIQQIEEANKHLREMLEAKEKSQK